MRYAVLAVLAVMGCAGPVAPEPPPELRVLSEGVAHPPGEQVDLGLLSRDCATRLSVQLRNAGTRGADLVISGAPELLDVTPGNVRLNPGEHTAIDFRVWPPNVAQADFASSLVVTTGVHELRFPLHGAIVTEDWDWPSRFDFGGAQVGRPAIVPHLEITGLTPPFSYDPLLRRLQFLPTATGIFEQRATIVRRADCTFRPTMVIRGEGVAEQLTGPAQVDFPDTVVGSSSELDVSIQDRATIGGFVELRPGDLDFSLVGSTRLVPALAELDGGLTPGDTILRVRFTPGAANARSGELWITSGGGHLVIPLRGLGLP